MDLTHFLADSPPSVVPLAIRPHFEALSSRQKLYAHHLSRAAFYGSRITLRQVSPESESIYDLITGLHNHYKGDWTQAAKQASITPEDLTFFLEYSAQFLGNLGNYKGFGDSKFIPRCPPETFIALTEKDEKLKKLCAVCVDALYVDEQKPALMHLGFAEKGHMTTYYPDSPHISQNEIEEIDKYVGGQGLLPENTRIRKLANGDFEILIAAGVSNPPADSIDTKETSWKLPTTGKTVTLVFGDYQNEMAKAALHMKQAAKYAGNETQKNMLDAYARSFSTGSLLAFKESQKYWVKDIGPAVESNIGFIETYRDPAGVRAEWEGMVAMVNKTRTAAFKKLVDAAPAMIPKLPWSEEFEKDTFTPPDFTSLEVLSFPGSGIPAGINIPNYDDIRQSHGFKNVSLGNVLSAKAPNETVPFIAPHDLEVYTANRDAAFEVQVGIHELLGHGTGKLLQETAPGKFNFDPAKPPQDPITKQPVSTYYKPSETYSTLFAAMSSSYEECRAECVAMALSCDFSILQIFGFGDGQEDLSGPAGDVLYASYLSMARAGIVALEYWDPKSGKWGQAHMQARFSILKTFLSASSTSGANGQGNDFCRLEYKDHETLSDLTIHIDRAKILTHGRPAVEAYLQKLHIYKCAANIDAGRKLYEDMTRVEPGFWAEKVRNAVLNKKTPRKVFVQATTILQPVDADQDESAEQEVILKEYSSDLAGMIQSWAERDI